MQAAEEERKKGEEQEQRQVVITLAEYQKNAEKAEAEKIEAEQAEFRRREDEVIALQKAKAKVKKDVAVARSELEEVEGSKKRGWEEREIW